MGLAFKKNLLLYFLLLLLLFFVFSFTYRSDLSFDQDLGRHLKLGEIITSTGQVPKTNLFSYTNQNFPFINHHFLFEVLLFWGNKILGLEIVLWLKILSLLFSVGLILSIVTKSKLPLILPIGYIFLHTLRSRVELRPEILSFLFTALTYYILTNFDKTKGKLIFILPLIQLIWINSHIYFFVGFTLQAIFLAPQIYQYLRSHIGSGKLKLAGFILVLSVVMSLINPNGLAGLLYPLQVFNNYGYTIAENQTIFLLESLNFKDPDFLFVKLSVLIVLASIITGLFRHTLKLKNLLLVSMGIFFALANVRSFPYLIFIALPATLENFGTFNSKYLFTGISVLAGIALLFESFIYLSGDYYKFNDKTNLPKIEAQAHISKAMDFVLKNDLPQPIFNNFDIGSYIIYRGFPKYRVFVDGRPESYPQDFFQKVYIPIQENPENFKEANNIYNFQTIIFSHTDQTPWGKSFLNFITNNPEWKTVFFDDFIIVLVKEETLKQKNLLSINLDKLSPDSYSLTNHSSYLRMSIFLFNTNHPEAARLFTRKALAIFPDSPVGNLIIANLTPKTNNLFSALEVQENLQKSKNPIWW